MCLLHLAYDIVVPIAIAAPCLVVVSIVIATLFHDIVPIDVATLFLVASFILLFFTF